MIRKCLQTSIVYSIGYGNSRNSLDNLQTHSCNSTWIHPQYSGSCSDIGLFYTDQPFTRSAYVRPVCLPSLTTNYTAGQTCVATGFGNTAFGLSAAFSTSLRHVSMDIDVSCSAPTCSAVDDKLCATGGAGKDTCLVR